jgi:UMF1 family MFS transporter
VTLERRRIVAWCLFDWANSPYTTLVVTFVYSAYFAQSFAPDVVTGTALWSRAVAIAGVATILVFFLLGGGLLLAVDEQRGIRSALPAS